MRIGVISIFDTQHLTKALLEDGHMVQKRRVEFFFGKEEEPPPAYPFEAELDLLLLYWCKCCFLGCLNWRLQQLKKQFPSWQQLPPLLIVCSPMSGWQVQVPPSCLEVEDNETQEELRPRLAAAVQEAIKRTWRGEGIFPVASWIASSEARN